MAVYRIAEKFVSINGEGTRAGQLAVFIRFAGCNLKCNYCDTLWANGEDSVSEELTEFEIYDYIKDTGVYNVTLTGGEPLLRENMNKLLMLLGTDKNIRVEIETNGSVSLEEIRHISDNVIFTIDYKLPGSGMETYMDMDNYVNLESDDTVKFVVSDRSDLEKMIEIEKEYNLTEKCNVYVSPVFGRIEPEEIVDFMVKNKMNGYNLQLQMHKIIWDPERRGV